MTQGATEDVFFVMIWFFNVLKVLIHFVLDMGLTKGLCWKSDKDKETKEKGAAIHGLKFQEGANQMYFI